MCKEDAQSLEEVTIKRDWGKGNTVLSLPRSQGICCSCGDAFGGKQRSSTMRELRAMIVVMHKNACGRNKILWKEPSNPSNPLNLHFCA